MLKINLKEWKKWNGAGQTLAQFVFEDQIPAAAKDDGFKAKEQSTFLYRPADGKPAQRVLLIGLGKKSDFTNETLRRTASKVLRGAESLDVLQAMNSGHDGSMATIHGSSPQDVVSRLETLVLMAGYDIPLLAVRQQISRAINIIIQMRRTPEGNRQIVAMSEVTGLQDGRVTMQDIFVQGRNRAGQLGFFHTGYTPVFIQQAPGQGIPVSGQLFGTTATPTIPHA